MWSILGPWRVHSSWSTTGGCSSGWEISQEDMEEMWNKTSLLLSLCFLKDCSLRVPRDDSHSWHLHRAIHQTFLKMVISLCAEFVAHIWGTLRAYYCLHAFHEPLIWVLYALCRSWKRISFCWALLWSPVIHILWLADAEVLAVFSTNYKDYFFGKLPDTTSEFIVMCSRYHVVR